MTSSQSPGLANSISLANAIGQTFIIAYEEVTCLLEKTLSCEGLNYKVLRQKHLPTYKNCSASYLCLLNHKRAWELSFRQDKLTLIVEADFVPVVGFGKLPLPFDNQQKNVGVAWLYLCASQLYNVSDKGYAEGFSTSAVAYIVTPAAAKSLIALEENVRAETGTDGYTSWDSKLDIFLRDQKFKNYISFRNYGEHGGFPNPEHNANGLSRTHRADVLYNQLAFMPLYSSIPQEDFMVFFLIRLVARVKGISRLVLGRFLRWKVVNNSRFPMRLITFAIRRQFCLFSGKN